MVVVASMIGARGLDEDVLGAMSFEALRGQIAAFDEEILALKPHPGMQRVGANLRALLHGSEVIAASKGIRTQDALSIRSIPQVHGACRDQMAHAERQIETELNGTTDNPLLLGTPDNFRVMSQANPHGESVAMAADMLAIAIAELGGIAERRIDRLINPLVSGLPPFLVSEPGVNSGMMIAQYVAASLCAENRQLAQPCVVDNYVTSALQEDHLSLGTGAALRLHKLLANVNQILAIEYLLAAQAFEFFATATRRRRYRARLATAASKGRTLPSGSLVGARHCQQRRAIAGRTGAGGNCPCARLTLAPPRWVGHQS
jgi:histidine ammonia-lyase